MELKENPTGEDLFKVMNEIKSDIESNKVYSRGQDVGTIQIKGKVYRVSLTIESPDGLEFFY